MDPVDRFIQRARAQRMGQSGQWQALYEELRSFTQRGDLSALERIFRALDDPQHQTLASMAWRGRVYAGPEGARAFLADVASPPACERGWPDRHEARLQDYGALLAHAWDAAMLATLLPSARTSASRVVHAAAIEERVLREGAVTDPALVAPPLDRSTFPTYHRTRRTF